jgi:tRNA(Ile)-lysidine synthase
LPERFIRFFKELSLLASGHRFMLAVSGGVDSVVLCELAQRAGLNFFIGHCNFGLRGAESERDENFVRTLGEKYGVEVVVKKFDTASYAEENKKSIQEAARDLRYQWFLQIRDERKFEYTLLAHHANDNIETVLMNFFRGTGLDGLTGMPVFAAYGNCLRPMLPFKREEIEIFARENNLQWVEDSSNASNKYTRNFFRNEIIPSIKKAYPQVEQNLLDNINRFEKTNLLYRTLVSQLKEKLCQYDKGEIRIPVKELMRWQGTSFIYELFREYGFGEKQVEEITRLASSPSGRYMENEMYQLIRHRNWLIVAPKFVATDMVAIEKEITFVRFQSGKLELKLVDKEKFRLDKSEKVAQLDAKNIEFPLLLRKWKQGDYFYPLGMRKKKKLARFFIDQKLSKNKKEDVWVMESNQRIVWVVGLRIDDRFKITEATKTILEIAYQG